MEGSEPEPAPGRLLSAVPPRRKLLGVSARVAGLHVTRRRKRRTTEPQNRNLRIQPVSKRKVTFQAETLGSSQRAGSAGSPSTTSQLRDDESTNGREPLSHTHRQRRTAAVSRRTVVVVKGVVAVRTLRLLLQRTVTQLQHRGDDVAPTVLVELLRLAER